MFDYTLSLVHSKLLFKTSYEGLQRTTISYRLKRRSDWTPHYSVDDWVDAGVHHQDSSEVWQQSSSVNNHISVTECQNIKVAGEW